MTIRVARPHKAVDALRILRSFADEIEHKSSITDAYALSDAYLAVADAHYPILTNLFGLATAEDHTRGTFYWWVLDMTHDVRAVGRLFQGMKKEPCGCGSRRRSSRTGC